MPTSPARSSSSATLPPRIHAQVSATVAARGRQDSPALSAAPGFTCHTPGKVRHKGISDHWRTPRARSCASGTQTNSASELVTSAHTRSIPPKVSPPTGAATLNAPGMPRSAASSANAAKSRTSTG